MKNLRNWILTAGLGGAIGTVAVPSARAQSIANGTFSGLTAITSPAPAYTATTSVGGQLGYNISTASWTGLGYVMIWKNSAETSVAVANDNGLANLGLYANVTAPPAGTGIVGGDADTSYPSLVYQLVTGLTVGQKYTINFYYAGAQQTGYSGTQQEAWDVGFTSTTPTTARPPQNSGGFTETPVLSNSSKGFTGWASASIQLTATATSDYLEFFSEGTPDGTPPYVLLTDVSMTAAPEPSTIFAAAFLLVPVGVRFARVLRKKAAAKA